MLYKKCCLIGLLACYVLPCSNLSCAEATQLPQTTPAVQSVVTVKPAANAVSAKPVVIDTTGADQKKEDLETVNTALSGNGSQPAADRAVTAKVTSINTMPADFAKPFPVGVTYMLDSVSKVSEATGNYAATIDFTLTWKDPSLAFDTITAGTFRLELCNEDAEEKLKKMWTPAVTIANMSATNTSGGPSGLKPVSLSQCLLISADGTVEHVQRIKGYFDSTFSLVAFPFDTQDLTFMLTSTRYDVTQLQFIQNQEEIDKSGIKEGFAITGWNIGEVAYKSAVNRGINGKFYPVFETHFSISRRPLNDLLAFAPLLLIMMMPTLTTLHFKSDVDKRIAAWSGALLALIAMTFALNLRYPALPSSSILNQITDILFAFIFLMLCLSVTVLNPVLTKRINNQYLIPEIEKFMAWSIPFGLIILILVRMVITALA